jgi:hypothetical protein
MVQMLLPIFPAELTLINNQLGFQKRDGQVYYFNGMMPIFTHREDDLASFRLITAQLAAMGNATQAELVRAFGISTISMKRWVKLFRAKGPKGFYEKRRGRGESVLVPEVMAVIQELLDESEEVPAIAAKLGMKADTLNKAIRDGRLVKREKKLSTPRIKASDQARTAKR